MVCFHATCHPNPLPSGQCSPSKADSRRQNEWAGWTWVVNPARGLPIKMVSKSNIINFNREIGFYIKIQQKPFLHPISTVFGNVEVWDHSDRILVWGYAHRPLTETQADHMFGSLGKEITFCNTHVYIIYTYSTHIHTNPPKKPPPVFAPRRPVRLGPVERQPVLAERHAVHRAHTHGWARRTAWGHGDPQGL